MALIPFQKFQCFAQDVGRKVHNLNADTLKVMLTDTLPVATNALKADITEIAAGAGYSAGGTAPAGSAFSQAGGIGKLTMSNIVFTASGGTIGPFRYAVLYNSSASGGPLIGFWDYGAEITLSSSSPTTNRLSVGADPFNGVLNIV